MKNFFFLLIVICSSLTNSFSQSKIASSAYIDTYYHGQKYFSIKDAAMILYDRQRGDLTIEIDFAPFKSGVDSLDEWLLDLTETKFIFKAHLPEADLPLLNHHNSKLVVLEGMASFNNVAHPLKIQLNMFEISKEGMLMLNNTNDVLDRIACNFQIAVKPKDFGVNKKPHHLKKIITIAIGRGILNHH